MQENLTIANERSPTYLQLDHMVGLLAYLVECSPPAISTLVLYPCRLRFRPPSRSCSVLAHTAPVLQGTHFMPPINEGALS